MHGRGTWGIRFPCMVHLPFLIILSAFLQVYSPNEDKFATSALDIVHVNSTCQNLMVELR